MRVTASELRGNVYALLDRVIATGEPLEIDRKGRILWIMPERRQSKLANVRERDAIVGDPESLAEVDWTQSWLPDCDVS
jgi:hypothetical protein